MNFPFISSNCWISLLLFIKIWCNKKNVCLQLNTSSSNDAATSWITIELKACSWHRICMSASTLEIIKLEICCQNWNRFFLKKIRLETLKQQSSVQNECNYILKVKSWCFFGWNCWENTIYLQIRWTLDCVMRTGCGDVFTILKQNTNFKNNVETFEKDERTMLIYI